RDVRRTALWPGANLIDWLKAGTDTACSLATTATAYSVSLHRLEPIPFV
ncbi:hypothetical protein ACSSVV_004281, partial [Marinobacter sp. MBR-105]